MSLRVSLLSVVLILLSGCTTLDITSVAPVLSAVPRSADPTKPIRTLEFGKLQYALKKDAVVTRYSQGPFCLLGAPSVASGEIVNLTEGALVSRISSALEQAGVKLAGDKKALFNIGQPLGDLVLAGRVVSLEKAFCGDMYIGWKIAGRVVVDWQLLSRAENRVVFASQTEGGFSQHQFGASLKESLDERLIESAVRNLLSLPDFWSQLQ